MHPEPEVQAKVTGVIEEIGETGVIEEIGETGVIEEIRTIGP